MIIYNLAAIALEIENYSSMKELHDHNCNLIIFCLHAIKEPNDGTTSHTCGKAALYT
jgi:hypothetical protein